MRRGYEPFDIHASIHRAMLVVAIKSVPDEPIRHYELQRLVKG